MQSTSKFRNQLSIDTAPGGSVNKVRVLFICDLMRPWNGFNENSEFVTILINLAKTLEVLVKESC